MSCVGKCLPICRHTDRILLEIDAGIVELVCGRVDGGLLVPHVDLFIMGISMVSLQTNEGSGVLPVQLLFSHAN